MKLELGNKVKDLITDFEGIIISRGSFITGCDRIEVKNKEGKIEWFDLPTVEFIDDGISKKLLDNGCNNYDSLEESLYDFGVRAKDKVTGYDGTIVGKCISLTGDITYGLSPKHDIKSKDNDAKWFDESRVEIKKHEDKVKIENKSSRTGGAVPNLKIR